MTEADKALLHRMEGLFKEVCAYADHTGDTEQLKIVVVAVQEA
jgi:hypothetical protein